MRIGVEGRKMVLLVYGRVRMKKDVLVKVFCVLVINKHNHTVHTGIYRFKKKKKKG